MAKAPLEVSAPPSREEAYVAWRATTDLRAPYRVAPEFLAGTQPGADFDPAHEAPLIVFINARSGGRVGPQLAGVLARALGRSQVFDLSEHRPDVVLARIWANLAAEEAAGNARAALVRSRLRILACGGDGTVAWIMKVVQQLGLQPQPPVAIMPLGTGNDLSRTFRWGAEFAHGWIKGQGSVYSTLKRIADAPVADLDCWRLRLLLPDGSYRPAGTYAMSEVPQQQQQQLVKAAAGGGGCAGEGPGHSVLMEGMFWNYFSVGADAQAAYSFHHLRDAHPHLAGSRAANQFWYSAFSCSSGWFCGAVASVSRFSRVEVLRAGSSSSSDGDGSSSGGAAAAAAAAAGTWQPLLVPPSIKALVLVNLQSYAGGRNIWGAAPSKTPGKWRPPGVADGLLEVVGFHSGYHALAVMASGARLAHGKRLAQVAGVRLALADGAPRAAAADGEPGSLFMQLDGEPWLQQVPAAAAGSPILLEVTRCGTSKVLANTRKPDSHPEKHVTALLTEQQQAHYLLEASAASKTAAAAAAAPGAGAPAHAGKQQQRAVHIAAHPATGRGLPAQLQEGGCAPAAAAAGLPPQRLVATSADGGAPCGAAAPLLAAAPAPAAASVPLHSLHDRDASSSRASASGASSGGSGSGALDPLAPLTPGAVASIEAVPQPQPHAPGSSPDTQAARPASSKLGKGLKQLLSSGRKAGGGRGGAGHAHQASVGAGEHAAVQ